MNIFQNLAERPKSNRTSLKLKLHLNCVEIRMSQRLDESYNNEPHHRGSIYNLGLIQLNNEEEDEIMKNSTDNQILNNMSSGKTIHRETLLKLHKSFVISKHNRIKRGFDLFMDVLIYYSVVTALDMLGFF